MIYTSYICICRYGDYNITKACDWYKDINIVSIIQGLVLHLNFLSLYLMCLFSSDRKLRACGVGSHQYNSEINLKCKGLGRERSGGICF